MTDYHFSTNWFEANCYYWSTILEILQSRFGDSLHCMEVGTWEGRAAIHILDNMVGPAGSLTVIDPFKGDYKQVFLANIAKSAHHSKVNVIEGDSVEKMPELLHDHAETYHFIYIDAGKTASDNMINLAIGERLLCVGGIMIVDDYMWSDDGIASDPRTRPQLGIQLFTQSSLLCSELSTPRTQAAFVKMRGNDYMNSANL